MQITYKVLAGAVLMAGSLLSVRTNSDDISEQARNLHFGSIVLDTHDDTPQRMLFEQFDLGHRDAEGQIDIPRMRDGGLNAIFFSIWTPATMSEPDAEKRAFALIDAVDQQLKKHPQDLALAKTAADVRRIHASGKIAVLMGVEGGHMINNDLAVLDKFAARGVRYMTLTHTLDTKWAGSSGDDAKHIGLNDFGKSVVLEMNLKGMMVDISHVSDQTFWDALAVSKAPMIASHSSCRALCDAPRNMTDDMIKALAAKGGVIQINYNIGFLSQAYRDASLKSAELKERTAAVEKAAGDNEAAAIRDEEKVAHQMIAEHKLPAVYWQAIVDHIDHAVKLVGADHVGLGSDYDGSVMPLGMEDCSKLPELTEAMLRKGYSEEDIRKILGGNTLRVMARVEQVSRDLQALAARKAQKQLNKSK